MKKFKTISPPQIARKLLFSFLRSDLAEEVEGDLEEKFYLNLENKSAFVAKMNYWFQVLNYLRPFAVRKSKHLSSNPLAMHKHNLLMAVRTFSRYKSSFLINLTGLTSGLTSVLLIYLWVADELSIDKFHINDDRLFQVMRHTPGPENTIETHPSNSVLLPQTLIDEATGVEYVVPVRPAPPGIISNGKESAKSTGWFVGKDFFKAFSYKLIAGDENTALNNKYAMVISDGLAIKIFGSTDNCVGKTIIWDLDHLGDTHVVSGVFKAEDKASEKFDFLVTYEMFLGKNRMDVNWNSNPIMVCLTLKPGTDLMEFNDKLNALYKEKRKEEADQMFLKKYSDSYLYGRYENGKQAGGRIDYVILFSVIAIFILIIACINFMNLSTARASRRLKEIGIKKSIGVLRNDIILQHLSESMLMTFISLTISFLFTYLFLPQFNLITGKHIELTWEQNLVLGALCILIVTGLLSGSYPAFYLSRFKPVDVLKGKLQTSVGESWVRKGLVVFQFGISILLIISVTIVYKQIDFVQSKNLGYNKSSVITFEKQGALVPDLEPFLLELKNTTGVVNASSMQGSITNITSSSWGHTWEGQLPGANEIEFAGATVNYDFFETFGLGMKEGRGYSREFAVEQTAVVLNEAAIDAMGMKDPIGKWIELFGTQREIIGVVKNFHSQSMYQPIKPMFILLNPRWTNSIVVKMEPGSERNTIERLDHLFHKYNPGIPFEVKFVNDEYNALYVSEQRVASLSEYFASIAIIVSCLGLFGMAAFTVERRTKEIGIRKTLGASPFGIVRLLSNDFTGIVFLAIIISMPIGYVLAQSWLAGFAYHVDLSLWLFIGTGILTLCVAGIAIGSHTLKATRINPVHCLKNE